MQHVALFCLNLSLLCCDVDGASFVTLICSSKQGEPMSGSGSFFQLCSFRLRCSWCCLSCLKLPPFSSVLEFVTLLNNL